MYPKLFIIIRWLHLDDFSDPDKSKNDVDRNNFSANSMKILSASGMEINEDVNCNFNVLSSQASDASLEQIENSNEDLDGKTVGDLPLAIANTQEDKDEEVGNSLFCDVAFLQSTAVHCFLNWFLSIIVSSEISLESNTVKNGITKHVNY